MQSFHYQALLIFACSFINAVSISVLLTQQIMPYISSLIMHFGLVDSRNDTGYYVGIIASAALFGRAFTAPVWGHLADLYGRRPLLIFSLVVVTVVSLVFSFVPNFLVAVGLRLCLGSLCSISVVAKTAATECVPDDSASTAMMMYSTGYTIGEVLGTAIGGFTTGRGLENYPYALPNLIVAGLSAVILLLFWLYFKETLPVSGRCTEPFSCKGLFYIMQDRVVLMLLVAYGLSSFVSEAITQLIPLLCWADRSHGGLNMDPQMISGVLTAAMCIAVVLQQGLYIRLVAKFGLSSVTYRALLLRIPLLLLLPWFSHAGQYYWVLLVAGLVTIYIFSFQVYIGIFTLLNSSIPNDKRGKLNGLGVWWACTFQGVSSIVSGSAFAWSLSINTFPVDYHLAFFVLSLVAAVQVALYSKTKSADKQSFIELQQVGGDSQAEK
jgi:MFS family permease